MSKVLYGLMCVAGMSMLAAPAHAEIGPGSMGVKAFQIRFSGQTVGYVVVVESGTTPPTGYASGKEYWTWTAGTPWRGAFKLVPTGTVPTYSSYTWQSFTHLGFDLSNEVPFPSISPGANDGFWRVDLDDGSSWTRVAYLWLDDGTPDVLTWYGVDLTSDLIGDGAHEIRFESVDVPAAGAMDVTLLD